MVSARNLTVERLQRDETKQRIRFDIGGVVDAAQTATAPHVFQVMRRLWLCDGSARSPQARTLALRRQRFQKGLTPRASDP